MAAKKKTTKKQKSSKSSKRTKKESLPKRVTREEIEKILNKLREGKKLTQEDIETIKRFREQRAKESPLAEFLEPEDVKAVEEYVSAVLAKFKKFVRAIAVWGSQKTGKGKRKTSDIDIAVIVDDTDVKTMTPAEVKDKLFQRLVELSLPISKKLHPQPYLLTEFWTYVREGNPVIYNLLRDGVVLWDVGFFKPFQILLRRGYITPSKERVDKNIISAVRLLENVKYEFLHTLTREIALSVVSAAQALLMELGYRPPTFNETGDFVEEFLVKKHKLVEKEYADIARKIVKIYKDIEHREKTTISGEEVDKMYKDAEKFVERIKKELLKIRKAKGETYLYEYFEKMKKLKKKETKKRDTAEPEERKKKEDEGKKIVEEEVGMR